MPFADKRRAIAQAAQERRQGRVIGWEPDVSHSDRFLETYRQAILVTTGNEAGACCRTDRRVRISLHEAEPIRGKAIYGRCLVVSPTIAGEIGIAHVVGHDEQNVRLLMPAA